MDALGAMSNGNGRHESIAIRIHEPDCESRFRQRGHRSLALLLEAREYALGLGRSVWDFAVEIQSLEALGLTANDLRWLLCKSLIQQARETMPVEGNGRKFRRGRGLALSKRSCFVLTDAGVGFARRVLDQDLLPGSPPQPSTPHANGSTRWLIPRWDRDRQEFRLGEVLIKRFQVPAPDQEVILAVFQEEGWPVRIDNPLPSHPEVDLKPRLARAIDALNRNQRNPLVRFLGEGSGEAVRWELAQSREGETFISPSRNGSR
jgi:hypothetical protein